MTDNLNFVTDGTLDRICAQRQHRHDVFRESLRNKLKDIAADTEKATDYCRCLVKAGADVSIELDELESTARGLLLVAWLMKREQSKTNRKIQSATQRNRT